MNMMNQLPLPSGVRYSMQCTGDSQREAGSCSKYGGDTSDNRRKTQNQSKFTIHTGPAPTHTGQRGNVQHPMAMLFISELLFYCIYIFHGHAPHFQPNKPIKPRKRVKVEHRSWHRPRNVRCIVCPD